MKLPVYAATAFSAAISLALTFVPASGLGHHNGGVQIDVTESGGYYILTDPLRPGISCGINGTMPVKLPSGATIGNGRRNDTVTACVDVLYGVQRMWDMLRDWLGRNGINGSGRGAPARIVTGTPIPGSTVDFPGGQSFPTQLDLVGHQYGHVVYQTTPGGTGAGNENGGINEGAADIFGTLTEWYANNHVDLPDYLIGEGEDMIGGGPLRHTYNPGLDGHPNCYSAQIPATEVHAASGPMRHWFYLLAEGSTPGRGKPSSPICAGGPASVTGIGLVKAGRVFMQSLLRKTSGWRYVHVRTASVMSAIDLYGPADPACVTVKAAWDAVSVPAQPAEPACAPAPAR
ncbi:M4 family metallopeptidase [Nonomuraea sp. NPDC050547]|uniref:M4 family metallopeptidase n=1 Tax=Nonomuraea sp. NPDC050547 TaxID=3364368 RepID=UPI0037B614CA